MEKKIQSDKVAEYYSSRGVPVEEYVEGGSWEQECEDWDKYTKPVEIKVWNNKEVEHEEYYD